MASSSICPFTLKPITDIQHDNLAIIYHSNLPSRDSESGHACTLSELVSHLHDGVCQTPTIGTVCDANASMFLLQRNNDDRDGTEGRIVSFKYGTISYHLWVENESNAIKRIATVMGMDVKNGLKVCMDNAQLSTRYYSVNAFPNTQHFALFRLFTKAK
jgi:hypothetical protein